MSFAKNFFMEEDGQDMVEYGLILALVVAAGVTIYQTVGGGIRGGLASVASTITAAL
ncbi:MAG: Flp family type IVb pilin [Bryobacteraceae bacterium]|jgi:Flp pilus assembly pilin Flp